MKLRVLSKQDVQQTVPMREAIEIVKGAFAQLSAGKAVVPLRTQLPVERHDGVTLFMPGYLSESDDLGVKIVSVFPSNLEMGLPTIFALVVVVEAATGRPMAAMDGAYLTALRTGAASGAATDLLARQDAKAAALRLADKGYVLETGRTILSGSAEELIRDERVRKAYLGEE
jgi:ornithine cyclodeaminase/alanine dehydrogenase-like protein (mu-crystallin family)